MNFIKILIVSLLVIIYAGCSNEKPQSSNAPKQKTFDVRITVAEPSSISNQIKISGTVGSRIETPVYSNQEGVVERLSVREGDSVKKGSVLCYIASSEHENLLAIARQDYEKVLSEESGKDTEKLTQTKKRLDAAKDLYKPFPVVCPVDGTVTLKNVDNGVIVSNRQALLTISDLNKLIVKTALPERYARDVKIGQKVTLYDSNTIDSGSSGVISMVYPVVDVKTRTFGIEITPDDKKALKPGMMIITQFTTKSKDNVISVVHDAVAVNPNGDKFVFTVKNGKAKQNSILSGMENNTHVEILSGIVIGDSVIVSGLEGLKEGAEVRFANPAAKPQNPSDKGKDKQ